MLQLNYKSGMPICDQIVNGFIRLKATGVMNAGDQLPSVRSLAIDLSINPNTVQKAYQILESGGVIYSIKGKGSFFSEDALADTTVMRSARAEFEKAVRSARELGLTETQLIEIIKTTLKGESGT